MFAAIAIGDLFAAGEVAFIMAIGAILEDMTTERAKKGLKKLISLAPTQGRKIVDGKEVIISAEEIEKEDILRVLPGETIPVYMLCCSFLHPHGYLYALLESASRMLSDGQS